MKGIAGAGTRRDFLPVLPSIAEAGLPVYVSTSYTGLLAPARMPPDIVVKPAEARAEVLRGPEITAQLRAPGAPSAAAGPESLP